MSVTAGGERARFESLFDQNFRAVTAYVRRRAAAGDADDVVAETFLIAWRRIDEVPADPRPWLLGVARRVLANQRRAAGRRAALAERVSRQPPAPPREEGQPQMLCALARLTAADREILLLAAWDGLSAAEAAVTLTCSRTAAKVRLHRAKRRLEAELAKLQRAEMRLETRPLEECHDES